MKELLHKLNPKQHEAVTNPPEHMLVLAGAGSGKTRVLVHRLAWLFSEHNIAPGNVLAVTFTNKAANEMRQRVESIFNINTRGLWIGTFHGIAHKLLRIHHNQASLSPEFQVMDSSDQYRLIRRILKNLNLDEQYYEPKSVQSFINARKEEGLRPIKIKPSSPKVEKLINIYEAYETACKKSDLVDFSELLLRSYELLSRHPEILEHYRNRFSHLLIDEFQDTNSIQYNFIKLLSNTKNFVMAVGDDDQSIYGWRGAKIENINKFQDDFPKVKVIRLEQNYRSTQTILSAANAVIANNKKRMGKQLWTQGNAGDKINLYAAYNEQNEAQHIVTRIRMLTFKGTPKRDIAILYRSNAQSRIIEETLVSAGIPYRIYGGLRFFDRAEIKNTLGYLRLINSPNDDPSFERIINLPARGIGAQSLNILRNIAKQNSTSLWQAIDIATSQKSLSNKAIHSFEKFKGLIEGLKERIKSLPLDEQVDQVIQATGLIQLYEKEPGEKAKNRLENLEELVNAAKQFLKNHYLDDLSPIAAFLTHSALEAGDDEDKNNKDSIQLMTFHAAKGLEFPVVFLTGMEDEMFPSRMALEQNPEKLEEERRLCYVGITRAMKQLSLTYAKSRRIYGRASQHSPSRFLSEIPEALINEIIMKEDVSLPKSLSPNKFTNNSYGIRNSDFARFNPSSSPLRQTKKTACRFQIANSEFKIGQRVKHAKFGNGIIINYEGSGPNTRIEIKFTSYGTKRLALAYAKLEKI